MHLTFTTAYDPLPGFVQTGAGRQGRVQGRLLTTCDGAPRLLLTCKDVFDDSFFSVWADDCFHYSPPALVPGTSPFVVLNDA